MGKIFVVCAVALLGCMFPAVSALPSNDSCASPTVISNLPYSITEDTTTATSSSDDPYQSCTTGGASKNGHSVWFKFTAPLGISYIADTLGSNYDTVLSVYTGSCGSFTPVACNDDYVNSQSQVTWQAQAGTTYYIEVTAFHTSSAGQLVFKLNEPAPVNDDCVNAIVLTGSDSSQYTRTVGATTEADEPVPTCGRSYNTLWYTFTPTSNGVAILNTASSDFDTILAVYTGQCHGTYTQVVCNDDEIGKASGSHSATSVPVQAGVTYLVQVGSFNEGAGGALWLDYHLGPAVTTIQQAKTLPVGTRVTLSSAVVTANLQGAPYVQDYQKPIGIYVSVARTPRLLPGAQVIVVGDTFLDSLGNVDIIRGGYIGVGYPLVIKPLGMCNKSVAGGATFGNQPGGFGSSGPNNCGVLVRTWGRVIATLGLSYYWIDDGSGLKDYQGNPGLLVWSDAHVLPQIGTYKVVTGVPIISDPVGCTPALWEPATYAGAP